MATPDRTTKAKLREIIDHKQEVIEQQAQEIEQLKAHYGGALRDRDSHIAGLKTKVEEEKNHASRSYGTIRRLEGRIVILTKALKDVSVESCC